MDGVKNEAWQSMCHPEPGAAPPAHRPDNRRPVKEPPSQMSQPSNVAALAASAPEWPSQATVRAREDTAYYPAFDWLRGGLAATVMLFHDHVIRWTHAGSFAVEVFFALSGWLIGGILLQLSREELPRFFFNRAIRIWVPYFIALGLVLAASLLKDSIGLKWLEFVAYKVTFVYNLFGPPQLGTAEQFMPLGGTANHFWSVNAEEQFYLLAPLLLVLAARRGGRSVALWLLVAGVAWIAQYYSSIVFGVLAAVAVRRFGPFHETPVGRAVLAVVAAASLWAIVQGASFEHLKAVCGVSLVLLLAFKGRKRTLGGIVGGMSYPLYLNHWIGVYAGNVLMSPFGLRDSPARQALAALLNVAFAVALYWWVDRRLLAQRRAWFTPERGRTVTALAYATTACGVVFGVVLLLR
jgi:peptidoglycan/LPS O-acetylase OafA/YrhL